MPRKAPVTFRSAPEVEAIAEELIEEHHPHLMGAKIIYVFRSKAEQGKGKVTLGTASKLSGLLGFLLQADFLIVMAEDEWLILSAKQKRALTDHELMHCGEDENGYYLRPHDVEEFEQIVSRHGLWKSDLAAFGLTCAEAVREGARHG
jgi:hypothetical protein